MKTTSDRLNVVAEYLDQKFESVSIYSGDLSFPGPDTVWFDVDPSSEGWLVIRRLQAFLDRYGLCYLRPYTYEYGREAPNLGWSLTISPSNVGLLASFIQWKDAEEAVYRAERAAEEERDAEGGPPMSTREPEASPFETAVFGDAEKGATP